ncbi:membrane protein [Caballeronia terrestris]|uniref:Membrane protein n=1 Tax=Caballeronia terrestris TaxID=1226301 RepID=A0A158H4C6_9BURK|nr:DUF3619 family protein [Caballeronia terrestris]SAL38600.1 membrane protein [Caballeronia terrestris]
MSTALESKENEFARKLVHALDETTSGIPAAAVDRLAAARRAAIARKKPEKVAVTAPAFAPAFAGAAGGQFSSPNVSGPRGRFARFGRFGLAWPVLALVIGLAGIAYWEDQERTAELADIDAAMLSDNLPLDAYLDHGFNAYLTRNH